MFIARPTYLFVVTLLFILAMSCSHGAPEFDPYKKASLAPGEEWKPDEREMEESFPAEDSYLEGAEAEGIDMDNLSLSQLIDIGLDNNPTTRLAWNDARAAAAAWAQARGLYYPRVSGTAGYFYAKGGGSSLGRAPFDEQYGNLGLSLNYLLLDFGGREAEIDAARLALINANWNQNQAIQNVLREVAVSFYNYIGSRAQVRADEINLKEAETSLEAAELRLKAGVGTLPDVLQARATLSQVQLDYVADKGDVQIFKGNLATSVGWAANTGFNVQEPSDEIPYQALGDNVDDLISLAMKSRPDVAAVQASVRAKEALVKEAKSEFFPEISATAQVLRWWVRPDDGANSNFTNYLIGVQLQVPIFQGFTILNALRQAEAELDSARSALKIQEQIVIEEVWDAYYNFKTAIESLGAADTLVLSAEESYDASLAQYRSGVGDIVELLNAQTTLAEARVELVDAKTAIFTSYADLINAIGTEIPTLGTRQEKSYESEAGEIINEQ